VIITITIIVLMCNITCWLSGISYEIIVTWVLMGLAKETFTTIEDTSGAGGFAQ
jgi:hypothetical protein